MSKRLQVLLPDEEMERIQTAASVEHVSVGEWVRRSLREVQSASSTRSVEEKLKALRTLAQMNLPTGEVEQINAEIEQGYLSDRSLDDLY